MRLFVLILAGALVTGCAATREPASQTQLYPDYDQAQSAALVFAPPVAMAEPPIDLDRTGRAEAAFWGLAGPSVTYHFVHTDDRMGSSRWGRWDTDHYRRRSVIITQGSSIR